MKDFKYFIPIDIYNHEEKTRVNEPVKIDLYFDIFKPNEEGIIVKDQEGNNITFQTFNCIKENNKLIFASIYILCSFRPEEKKRIFNVFLSDKSFGKKDIIGIKKLPTKLDDGFVNLDTGKYIIELCKGTAQGHGGSKWGIRYFENKDQGINLIKDSNNAFGGVYGPFFTVENGLINPPAHMIMDIDVVTEGPLACIYRMHGKIPNGLREELKNKSLSIYWSFFFNSDWFIRSYYLDDYMTEIDGKECKNKMTVGDEIESGKDNLLLNGYRHYDDTDYRSGDLYAEILLKKINELKESKPELVANAMKKLNIDPNEDPSSWHWDNYWRMFCLVEDTMPREDLKKVVKEIGQDANKTVWSNKDHCTVKKDSNFVDVNQVPQQTIFAINTNKSCESNSENNYSFVRYSNNNIGRLQIVQRKASGWVNWGTNGENEFPELPSGSTIYSAYGKFDNWKNEVDKMEERLSVKINQTLKNNN